MIRLEEVTFSYGSGPPTLDRLSLTVQRGEMVALMGPNGSGKSTLARLLNGLLLPQQGRVLVDGLDTRRSADRLEIRRRVGMVFQDPDSQLVASQVEEETAFGPQNLGLPPEEIRRRCADALEAAGLAGMEQREVHTLSGGQKQLLAIAGALAMQPGLLVLDEATSMLDSTGRRNLLELIARLHRERGLTVILITHLPVEAASTQRVVVLREGRVRWDGTPAGFFGAPEAWEDGLEAPPLVELARVLQSAGLVGLPSFPGRVEEMVEALCSYNWKR